jgi:hypothetical protein
LDTGPFFEVFRSAACPNSDNVGGNNNGGNYYMAVCFHLKLLSELISAFTFTSVRE